MECAAGNLGQNPRRRDVVDEWAFLLTDLCNFTDRFGHQVGDLLVAHVGRCDNKRTNARIQDGLDFELISSNVLVLGKEDPSSLADDRQEVHVPLASELVEWFGIVAL